MENIRMIGSKFLELEAKKDPNFSGKLELNTNIQIESLEKLEKSQNTLNPKDGEKR